MKTPRLDRRSSELLTVRCPQGTVARVRASLQPDEENVATFVRAVIAAELTAREETHRRERALANVAGWIA